MYISYLSLKNQRIRNALKSGDTSTAYEAIHLLLDDNSYKAQQLADWFSQVAVGSKKHSRMTQDLAIMRMWLVGNVDIKEIQETGEPLFILTHTGSQVVKTIPKEMHFEALLNNPMEDVVS